MKDYTCFTIITDRHFLQKQLYMINRNCEIIRNKIIDLV